MLIYKILRPAEWADFERSGSFDGSPDDIRDGFIHCSSRAQLSATAGRIFAAEPRLVVVSLDAVLLGEAVRWEPSSGGDLFPHAYRPLSLDDVRAVHHVAGAGEIEASVPL